MGYIESGKAGFFEPFYTIKGIAATAILLLLATIVNLQSGRTEVYAQKSLGSTTHELNTNADVESLNFNAGVATSEEILIPKGLAESYNFISTDGLPLDMYIQQGAAVVYTFKGKYYLGAVLSVRRSDAETTTLEIQKIPSSVYTTAVDSENTYSFQLPEGKQDEIILLPLAGVTLVSVQK